MTWKQGDTVSFNWMQIILTNTFDMDKFFLHLQFLIFSMKYYFWMILRSAFLKAGLSREKSLMKDVAWWYITCFFCHKVQLVFSSILFISLLFSHLLPLSHPSNYAVYIKGKTFQSYSPVRVTSVSVCVE